MKNINFKRLMDSRRVKDDRFDDVTGEIQKGVDAYADVFYPYDQSNPENGEFFRNNKDRFKKHFSGRGVSVSERELSGRNGLYFERMKDSRRVKDDDDYVEGENEYIVTVAVVGSESMTNEEAEQYEDELKDALEHGRWEWDGYFGIDLAETMDRVGVGESVAVWAWCYADSQETVYNAVNTFTSKFDYDVRIDVRPAID